MNRIYSAILLFISLNNYALARNAFFSDFTSPVTTDAKYITAGGVIASGLVYLNKRSRNYRRRESYDDAKPFGEFGIIGNYLGLGILNAIYTGAFYFYGKVNDNQHALDASAHMAKASLYSLGLTFALKKSISEKRPGFPDDDDSFPSGHSSGAFSFASVIASQHGWIWGGGAYALASFISFSRINDDYHYLHDVIFGMTIGASYGWGIYYNNRSKRNHHISLLPLQKGASLVFSYIF